MSGKMKKNVMNLKDMKKKKAPEKLAKPENDSTDGSAEEDQVPVMKHKKAKKSCTSGNKATSEAKRDVPKTATKPQSSSATTTKRSLEQPTLHGGKQQKLKFSLSSGAGTSTKVKTEAGAKFQHLISYIRENSQGCDNVVIKKYSEDCLPLSYKAEGKILNVVVNSGSLLIGYFAGLDLEESHIALALANALILIGKVKYQLEDGDFSGIRSHLNRLLNAIQPLKAVGTNIGTLDLGLLVSKSFNLAIRGFEEKRRGSICLDSGKDLVALQKCKSKQDLIDKLTISLTLDRGIVDSEADSSASAEGGSGEGDGSGDDSDEGEDLQHQSGNDESSDGDGETESEGEAELGRTKNFSSTVADIKNTLHCIFAQNDDHCLDMRTLADMIQAVSTIHPKAQILSKYCLKGLMGVLDKCVVSDEEMTDSVGKNKTCALSHKQLWEWLYVKGPMTKPCTREFGDYTATLDKVEAKLGTRGLTNLKKPKK